MEIADVREGIEWQFAYTDRANAPCTSRIVRSELAIMESDTEFGRRIRDWPSPSVEDALPLRIAGGLHNLFLTGAAPELGPIYRGELTDQGEIDALVLGVVRKFDAQLLPWLDGPPQTNEAGRAASLMAGLLWLAQRLGTRFELNEIGASAGVNTMMERYFFDLGGTRVGPEGSPMRIVPEWRGSPPPAADLEIVGIRGSDVAPLDLSDPAQALRIKSYVWPEATQRMQRIEAAIALAAQQPPDLVEADAGEWVPGMLAQPQDEGVTRVLYHSIMWQYMPISTRASIVAAMEEAGTNATRERPLAWIQLETNRVTFNHELAVRFWPDPDAVGWVTLANAHPHGAWVEWLGR
jgi:hypothetical protein